ncbi:MAG: (Fe-S)-binding protein [Chloroflexota bacterium]
MDEAANKAIDLFVQKTGGQVASLLEACTRCGMCAEACHYYQATHVPEYTPIWKVEMLRRTYEQRFTWGGKLRLAMGLDKEITNESLAEWSNYDFQACSMCNMCSMVCPMGINISSMIGMVRSGITAAGLTPEGLAKKTATQLETGSPNGATEDDYAAWFERSSKEMGRELPIDVPDVDILLVLTNLEYASFPGNLASIAKILDAAGISWTLSMEARDAFNMGAIIGNGKIMRQLADKIYNAAVRLRVKRVLVSACGHGFTTLRDKLPNARGEALPFEVIHIAELMGDVVSDGRVKLQQGFLSDNGHTYTFHDSCKIQRMGGIMDEPRLVLKQMAGDSFHEMLPNREQAICCGGGGGVRAIPEAFDTRMAAFELKVKQVENADADVVVTTCSNCRLQFMEGFKHYGLDKQVSGLAELMAQAIIE